METEQEKFLKDLEPGSNEFGGDTEQVEPVEEKPEEEEPGNRRERRLTAKLQAERESSIALAAKLEVLTEAQKFRNETELTEYEKKIELIYGNATPEAVAATNLLRDALNGVKTEATKEALAQFREEQRKESDAVKKEETTLDSMVEDLEDEHGITIDGNTQKGFFQLLEKLSPKDNDGNVIAYADHHAVWEELQTRQKKPIDNRSKDLASRGMIRSSSGNTENLQVTSQERWLKEHGVI